MEFAHEVIHDVTQMLWNHHPYLIRIALQLEARTGLKKSSYFKLDANKLEEESTCVTLQAV